MTEPARDEKALFLAALEKTTPRERRAFLEGACAGDPDLLGRIEELLATHEQSRGPLDSPPPGIGVSPTIDQPLTEKPGTQIGPYKLLQQIGEGGMGVVYMAEQSEPVQRRVALKIIKPGMDTRQVIARFEAERQALAMMDHPNIAKVFDAGTTGGNPKSEARNPKQGGNPKSESRNPKQIQSTKSKSQNLGDQEVSDIPDSNLGFVSDFGFRASDLDIVSDFGFRHSDFPPGRPYFVMELVKGVPITQYCDEHQLTPRERLELFVPVCQAVQHAHQKGIIHRDIKPSNVLVAEYDDRPVPKVIDFGVAKAIQQRLTEKSMFTQFGQVVGTIDYMSPEQAKLNQLDIDTRSDIYSLGVLLYELLTGETPLDRERLRSAAFDEMLRIIREEEPPKPSIRLSSSQSLPSIAANRQIEPKKLSTLVRGELDWIVMKALDKDRARRYESANGFAADVQRYLSDEPLEACPPSAMYRLKKFARRNRHRFVAGGCLGVAAVATLLVPLFWHIGQRQQQEAAARAVDDAMIAGSTAFEADDLARTERAIAEARAVMTAAGQMLPQEAQAIDALESEVARRMADAEAFARFQSESREAQSRMGNSGALDGDEKAREALAIFGVLSGGDWITALRARRLSAGEQEQIKETAYETLVCLADSAIRWRRGQQSARESLKLLAAAEAFHHPTKAFYWVRAECHGILGDQAAAERDRVKHGATPAAKPMDHYLPGHTAGWRGDREEARRAYEAALELQPDHYNSLFFLAERLAADKRFDEAVAYYSACIALRPDDVYAYTSRGDARDKSGDKNRAEKDYLAATHAPATAVHRICAFDELLSFYRKTNQLGKHSEALARLKSVGREMVARQTAAAGPNDLLTLEIMSRLARALMNAGATDDAVGLLRDVVPRRRALYGTDHFKTLLAMNNLGLALTHARRADQAVLALEESLVVARKLGGDSHPDTLTVSGNLGDAYVKAGQPHKGIPLLEKAYATYRSGRGPDDPTNTLSTSRLLGFAYNKAKNWGKSVPLLEDALERHVKLLGAEDFRTLEVMNTLGNAYNGVPQPDKAVRLLEDAREKHARIFGTEHTRTLAVTRNLGSAYLLAEQFEKAISLLGPSLETHVRVMGADHLDTLKVMNSLGAAYLESGRAEQAVPILTRSLQLRQRVFGPDHDDTLLAMSNLGHAYVLARQAPAGLELLEKALQSNVRLHGAGHPESLSASSELLEAYRRAGQWDKAERLAHSRLQQVRQAADEIGLASALATTGEILLARGKCAEAEPLLRECLKIRESKLPDSWLRFNALSLLGGAFQEQGRHAEAEPLLLQAFDGLKQREKTIPRKARRHVAATAERLVKLYEAMKRAGDAAKWKERFKAAKANDPMS